MDKSENEIFSSSFIDHISILENETFLYEDIKLNEDAKPKPQNINIRDCVYGDLIQYTSSRKVYVVAEKTDEYRLLVSATQKFRSFRTTFTVTKLMNVFDIN